MPTTWYNAEVASIVKVSPTVNIYFIKLYIDHTFEFLPGQFVTFDLPIGEKRLHRWKSYSIANVPNENNILELCIAQMPHGIATTYLFSEVKLGSLLKLKGPDGGFVLPQNIEEKALVMICTGTGIAPFISMLRYLKRNNVTAKRIHLIFGTRNENDILYESELKDIKSSLPYFTYDIVLSKSENWIGYKGHVHQVYLKDYKEKNDQTHFYICGWSKMIDEAVVNLITVMKVEKANIHYELYG